MIAKLVTRCEVYLTTDEKLMLSNLIEWANDILSDEDNEMPEGIAEVIQNLEMEAEHLMDLSE